MRQACAWSFVKPGGEGAVVQWHQDFSYWDRTGPMAHLTVHIALDDQTLENGALHWVPGSHRWTRDGGPIGMYLATSLSTYAS